MEEKNSSKCSVKFRHVLSDVIKISHKILLKNLAFLVRMETACITTLL